MLYNIKLMVAVRAKVYTWWMISGVKLNITLFACNSKKVMKISDIVRNVTSKINSKDVDSRNVKFQK